MPPPAKYTFDPRAGTTGRYRAPDGRFISERQVGADVRRVIRSVNREMRDLAGQLRDGSITIQQWYDGMRNRMKYTHTLVGSIARGGWKQMSQADWGRIGAMSRRQYEYLNNFARQLAAGTLTLDGRLIVRAGMYANAAWTTYQENVRIMAAENGYRQERRVLNPAAQHCEDCIEEADRGWQPIGELRPIGDSKCIVNCACRFEFKTQVAGYQKESLAQILQRIERAYA